MQQKQFTLPWAKKFKGTVSAGKIVLAAFWDSLEVLLANFQRKGDNINAELYL